MSGPNYFDQNAEEDDSISPDRPDEIEGEYDKNTGEWKANSAPPVELPGGQAAPRRPTTPTVQLPQNPAVEEQEESEEEFTEVLSDARFRLEQGRLYEMVLNHDLFNGVEADKQAIKVVQDEIRAYAQERMEIMLGMRQESSKEPNTNAYEALAEVFPFNSLEVEALKSLAAAATKGASRDAAPMEIGPQPAPARTTLNPISKASGQTRPVQKSSKPLAPKAPTAPVKRTKKEVAIQRILEEEGVTMEEMNTVFDPNKKYLSPEEFSQLTTDQVIERNRQISVRNKQAHNPQAIPMPSPEAMEQMAVARATQAAAHPQMQQIMKLLEAQPKKG